MPARRTAKRHVTDAVTQVTYDDGRGTVDMHHASEPESLRIEAQ